MKELERASFVTSGQRGVALSHFVSASNELIMADQSEFVDPSEYQDSYGNLFRPGRQDALKRVLQEKVAETFKLQGGITSEDVKRTIDQIIELDEVSGKIKVDLRTIQWLHTLSQDDRSKVLCVACQKAMCCLNYRKITLNFADVQRLSKRLNQSEEDFITDYCKHHVYSSDRPFIFQLKNTSPCEFLVQGQRCRVYEDRPTRCMRFPLVVDEKTQHITGVRVKYFCNALFNMLRYEVAMRVMNDFMQKSAPSNE